MNNDALASLQEVAGFTWSVIELLFTRVLPLLGFLVAHLVWQAGSLAVEVVSSSSPSTSDHRRRRRRLSLPNEEPAQQSWAADLPSPAAAARWPDSSLRDGGPPAPAPAAAAHLDASEKTQPLAAPEDAIAADPEPSDLPRGQPSDLPQGAAAASGNSDQAEPHAAPIAIAASENEEQPQSPSLPQAEAAELASPAQDDLSPAPNSLAAETHRADAAAHDGQQERSAIAAAEAAPGQVAQPATVAQPTAPSDQTATKVGDPPSGPLADDTSEHSDPMTRRRVDDDDRSQQEPEVGMSEQETSDSIPAAARNEGIDRQEFTRRRSPSQSKRHPFAKILPRSLSQIKYSIMQRSRRSPFASV